MNWREAYLRHFGPGLLGGISFGDWFQLLQENRFGISPACWFRALSISFGSIVNSLYGWWENRCYDSQLREVVVEPPLFVLGHWRSGTTHLHNLLTTDSRFAFPNNYQVFFPHTFLSTEESTSRFIDFFLPARRPMDNIEWNIRSPQEDEFALGISTSYSPYLGWIFPERQEYYDRYLTFRGVPDREIKQWQEALKQFLRKLTWKYQRPLILKSPTHTCRIRLLLEMFPQAKFVHIHRNPYTVFQSTRKMFEVNFEYHRLQVSPRKNLNEWIFRQYRQMYEIFFEERRLIPEENFHEVGFEALEADPIGTVRKIYHSLNLPEFEKTEMALRGYVESIAHYQKNRFRELPRELRSRIAQEWNRSFEEWGYPI